ncbi:MAG: hypothetical protein ACAI34_09435 [Verrucomicrobium sp.]
MKTTLRAIFLGLLLASPAAGQSPSSPELRQRIIRVPQLDAVKLLTTEASSDANIVETLTRWLADGRAQVVSDVTTAVNLQRAVIVSDGRRIWLPSEKDQDFDRLFLVPTNSDEELIGMNLTVELPTQGDVLSPTPTEARWFLSHTELDPLLVKWPASWLEGKDGIHGWMEWYDTFRQTLGTELMLRPGTEAVVGVFPAVTHAWPTTENAPPAYLDLAVAGLEIESPAGFAPPKPKARAESQGIMEDLNDRLIFTGILISSYQALQTLASRPKVPDEKIFATLLQDLQEGRGGLRFCLGSACRPGQRIRQESGRDHEYPTEMPSIPSAWDQRLVGTSVDIDPAQQGVLGLVLEHHIAPPRRQEWRLGVNEPELQMWEPAFRRLKLNSYPIVPVGACRLIGAMKVPFVMTGAGLKGDETLLVFAHHQGPKPQPDSLSDAPADPFAPNSNGAGSEPVPDSLELELQVFEVPVDEAAKWQTAPQGQWAEPDTKRFEAMMKKVKMETARLVAQGMLLTRSEQSCLISLEEERMTATEFDPATDAAPHRTRPTALDQIHTGTLFEVESLVAPKGNGVADRVELKYEVRHSTALPEEPTLEMILKSAGKDGEGPYDEAVRFESSWQGQTKLKPGEPMCLGAKPVAGEKGPKKVLVAFITARVVENAQ